MQTKNDSPVVTNPFTYIEKPAALEGMVSTLLQKPTMTLALDTETTGLDPLARRSRILLCQIATADGQTWVINAAKVNLKPLQPLFTRERLVVLQNSKFDVKWLFAHYGLRIQSVFDTMLAELLLNAGTITQPHQRRSAASLKSLAARYLGMTLDKSVRQEFVGYLGNEFTRQQLQYAADDVPLLLNIKAIQSTELQHYGLLNVAKLEFQSVYPVARMELNGLGINVPQYEHVIAESLVNKMAMDAKIREWLRKRDVYLNLFDEVDINLDSPKQLREAFVLLGEPMESTDEKSLKKSRSPFAEMLLEYREYETQVSTFGEPVLKCVHPMTGRIHAEFDQLGTDSGRFSCNRPNLQQIPAIQRFRGNFVPAQGNVMVVGDWSQFELRILCFYSKDANMLAAFEAGLDLHSDTASRMYGIPYEEVTKDHPARKDAKILNFALIYGMGPQSMADSLKCTVDEAKEKMERWFNAYPGNRTWLEEAARTGLRNLETRTVSGRRRSFKAPEPGEEYKKQCGSIQRRAKNTPIQGSNGDALKRAMIRVQQQVDYREYAPGMVACVHDEIVLEVNERDGEAACQMLKAEMQAAGQFYLPGVPIKADVGIAPCWQK